MAYDRDNRASDDRFRGEDRYRSGHDDYGSDGPRSGNQSGRGFFERAGDEISSWFGDEEAERRREQDDRSGGSYGRQDPGRGERGGWFGGHNDREQPRERDEQDRGRRDYGAPAQSRGQQDEYRPFAGDYGRGSSDRHGRGDARGFGSSATMASSAAAAMSGSSKQHDPHYAEWRQRQIAQLDNDYDDYRREHQSKFDNDFSGWRTQRQTKRQTLGQVREHMEVVGSDEQPVGIVDKVQGDKIILTRDSQGGIHKSLGCSAIDRVEGDRLILTQGADEARRSLVEERGFQEHNASDVRDVQSRARQQQTQGDGPHILERSFSGTYPNESNR